MVLSFPASALDTPVETKLRATDAAGGDRFAFSVAIDGDRAVFGSRENSEAGSDAGAAYVFHRTGGSWQQIDKLLDPSGGAFQYFGSAVAIDGDWLAVATAKSNGAVLLYEWDGANWGFAQELTASDVAFGHEFGRAVALENETLVVGSPGAASLQGALYVYQLTSGSWGDEQKLVDPDGAAGDRLGFSVDLDGDALLAGAPTDVVNTAGGDRQAGSASLFLRAGGAFAFDQKIWSFGARVGIDFGTSVAIDGSEIAIGAPDDLPPFTNPTIGTVYRYDATAPVIRDTQLRVYGSSASGARGFGHAVALDDDLLVIGAFGTSSETGAVFLFDLVQNPLNETLKVTASDAIGGARFGWAVAVNGITFVSGADLDPLDEPGGENAGAAYVYTVPEPSLLVLQLVAVGSLAFRARASRRAKPASTTASSTQ